MDHIACRAPACEACRLDRGAYGDGSRSPPMLGNRKKNVGRFHFRVADGMGVCLNVTGDANDRHPRRVVGQRAELEPLTDRVALRPIAPSGLPANNRHRQCALDVSRGDSAPRHDRNAEGLEIAGAHDNVESAGAFLVDFFDATINGDTRTGGPREHAERERCGERRRRNARYRLELRERLVIERGNLGFVGVVGFWKGELERQ